VFPAKNVFTIPFQAAHVFSASWTKSVQTAESTVVSQKEFEDHTACMKLNIFSRLLGAALLSYIRLFVSLLSGDFKVYYFLNNWWEAVTVSRFTLFRILQYIIQVQTCIRCQVKNRNVSKIEICRFDEADHARSCLAAIASSLFCIFIMERVVGSVGEW
jgi:hypothetical protein